MPRKPEPCRLYLITKPEITDLSAYAALLEDVFAAGDVACLQLRLKGASDEEILKAAEAIMPVCVSHDVAFLINDRVDLALKAEADGVHLGQGDGSIQDAREVMGPERIVGVSCHASQHLGYAAGEQGADYIAFGAFYDTKTKETTERAEKSLLENWSQIVEIPCVAIGGITTDTARELADAGASFVAVCSGVWDYKDGPAAAVKAFTEVLTA